ncbi:unnamed protein product, partial [Heterotrigona itama]
MLLDLGCSGLTLLESTVPMQQPLFDLVSIVSVDLFRNIYICARQYAVGMFDEENFEIPLRHDAALKSPEETPSNRYIILINYTISASQCKSFTELAFIVFVNKRRKRYAVLFSTIERM